MFENSYGNLRKTNMFIDSTCDMYMGQNKVHKSVCVSFCLQTLLTPGGTITARHRHTDSCVEQVNTVAGNDTQYP